MATDSKKRSKRALSPHQLTNVAKGVRCRVSKTRRHGVGFDRYYTLRYTVDGRQVEHGLGWASEGWDQTKASAELQRLKDARRGGEADTLRELEQQERDRRKAEKEAQRQTEAAEAARRLTLESYYTNTYKPWAETTKPKAITREDDIWRNWLKPHLGTKVIADIDLRDYRTLVVKAGDAGLSERSREYITGTLRRIMKHYAPSAPHPTGKAVGATAPKDNRRQRVIGPDELQMLLAKLKARDIGAWRVTMFATGTGCRAGEAYGLQWRQIDLEQGKVTFLKTKNSNQRTVRLGEEIRAMLEAMPAGKPTELVFPNQNGGRYCAAPAAFEAIVEAMKLNDGREALDRFSFHSLRHMAATRLARVLSLRALMDVMGWKVAAMALRYSHSSETDMETAAKTLDTAFQATGTVVPMHKARGA